MSDMLPPANTHRKHDNLESQHKSALRYSVRCADTILWFHSRSELTFHGRTGLPAAAAAACDDYDDDNRPAGI